MIVQASVTSRFLECYATSVANLRGAKQRKKVRFTTAFGGANECSKQFYFYIKPQRVAEHTESRYRCILFYFYIKPQRNILL